LGENRFDAKRTNRVISVIFLSSPGCHSTKVYISQTFTFDYCLDIAIFQCYIFYNLVFINIVLLPTLGYLSDLCNLHFFLTIQLSHIAVCGELSSLHPISTLGGCHWMAAVQVMVHTHNPCVMNLALYQLSYWGSTTSIFFTNHCLSIYISDVEWVPLVSYCSSQGTNP
jgi:hypothetical protein